MTDAEVPALDPIIGSYAVKVTLRGDTGDEEPTLAEIEELIEEALKDVGSYVRATAERTDK
jgi:hypothetical protein